MKPGRRLRPEPHDARGTRAIGTTIPADIKARIDEEADRRGLTQSQVIAYRLQRSFDVDDMLRSWEGGR